MIHIYHEKNLHTDLFFLSCKTAFLDYAKDNPDLKAAMKMVETANDVQNAVFGTVNIFVGKKFGSSTQGLGIKNIDGIGNMINSIRNR